MDLDQWLYATAKLKAMGVRKVVLIGGEPTLKPWFHYLLLDCLKNFQQVTIQTNGLGVDAVTQEYLDKYAPKAKNLSISVSFEDADEEMNDSVRGKGVFKKALAAVRKYQQQGFDTWMRATIMSWNDVIGLRNLANELEANFVAVRFLPQGYGSDKLTWMPGMEKLFEVYTDFSEAEATGRIPGTGAPLKIVQVVEDPQYYLFNQRLMNKYKSFFLREKVICPAGRQVSVSPRGYVSACHMFVSRPAGPYYVGKILEDSVESLQAGLQKFNEWRNQLEVIPSCANCSLLSICGAGCLVFEKMLGKRGDPWCPIEYVRSQKRQGA